MHSALGSEQQKSQNSGALAPCALWPVDLKITHLDWNPEAVLIHVQGQYLTICELDYNILQGEIQNVPKTKTALAVGEFCLVEDLSSARWYRGRVQNRREDLFDVFLIDHGNVLSVGVAHLSSCSNDLFNLPPKIVCGFLANVLLLQCCSHAVVNDYFSSLIGRNVAGYIQAQLPHKVLLLEAPDINRDLVRHGFGKYVDTDTFLLLVEMLTEVPLKQNIEPVPDLLIEKPRRQDFCFNPSGWRESKDILSFCGPRLSCGMRVQVRVTAAVSPGLFYCQMASANTDLWEMSKKLAAVCEHKTKLCNQRTETEILGLLCSVKARDGKWYRGCVQFLPVSSQVRVLLIDYGFFESVKVENVHRLPPEFCLAPIMAFPCSLYSLSGQDEAAKTQQLSFLKAGLLGAVLDVEISSFEEEQHFYSITVFGVGDNNVEQDPIQEPPRMQCGSVFETEEVSPQGGHLCHETDLSKVIEKTLEVEEVQADTVFVGYVEYVQNPNCFWIRTQKRNDEFEEMTAKLADHFHQVKLHEDILLNPEPGTLCCAVYEKDMHFYRGVVTDILDHGAEVLFIDFGNIEKVPKMLIKKIPEVFASKSAFAFCCSLNVFPLDEVWPSDTTDVFRQAVSNKALLVRVVHKKKNKYVVELHEMGRDNNLSISELLVSSKQAECWNNPMKSVAQGKEHMSKNTTIKPGYVTSDINKNAEQWKEEQNICKNETEKAQSAVFKVLCIKPGCELAVCCSCINSPFDFWCQPLNKVSAIQEVMEKVQWYYSTHTVPLQPGESRCIFKSHVDGRWYRAFITGINGGYASVLSIDYGFTARISEHNLQAIMPEYLDLEGQAFRCSLNGLIEPVDLKNCGRWSSKAHNSLKEFINNSTHLTCKVFLHLNVLNKGLFNVVDLYDAQTQQSVTQVLVKKGLARDAVLSKQLATAFPESFVYCSYDLSPGKEEVVYVTHVSSQWEVYCHLERNTEIIEGLEKKISVESEKMKHVSTTVVRKLCLAKYFDGKWYRGLAHPVQSPLHLSVFFVDYGNSNISEKTHVMFIPRDSVDLLCTPMQAVRCTLASVLKEELYADAKKWLDEAVLNKQMRAVLVGKSKDGSFDVQLFDGGVNINEKVNGLICSLSPKPVTSFTASSTISKHKDGSDKCKGQDKRYSLKSLNSNTVVGSSAQKWNTYPKITNDRGRVPPKNRLVKQNHGKTKSCVSKTPQKHCGVKDQRVGRHTSRSLGKPQHTKQMKIPQLSCLPSKKLGAGFKAECFVSHIETISSFFLQLSEDEPAILKMAEDLNSDVFRHSLKTAASLWINDLVLAEYEEDGALYRAVVKDHQGSSCLIVEFIDYGNSAAVEKQKLYPIPKNYLFQPRLSISCSLLDTSPQGNAASFTDAVMEKPLVVEFVRQCESQWEVKVDILDAAVLPGVESNAVTKNEAEHPASSTQPSDEGKVESCGQPGNDQEAELCENEATKSEKMTPAAETQNMPKPPVVTLSVNLKPETSRLLSKSQERSKNDRKTSESSLKVARDCTEAFLPTTVHAGDSDSGTVLSVHSNCTFYIRPAKTRGIFTALQSLIADYVHTCKMVAEEHVKPGLNCLAKVDNKWHRAVIQQAGLDTCHILLVDHGVEVETSRDSLRQQCSGMEEISNLAVLCRMSFGEGTDAQMLWEQTLKPVIGEEVKLVFVNFSEAENLWVVETDMNGLFPIHQIAALSKQNQDFVPSPAETQNEATERGPSVETSPPQRLAFAPVVRDKSYFGFATALTTPFEFCVVLEDLLLIVKKVSVVLGDLPKPLSPLPEAHLITGACCLIKSDSEHMWCRAEVVSADASVVLHLVDYGKCELVPYKDLSKLKRLPEELLNLPKVMYPCILRGVKPVEADGRWTDEVAVFFQQFLYQKKLQIFFREFVSNTHWNVDIVADGVYVAKDLVDAGHASYTDVILELRFQQQNPPKASPQDLVSREEPVQQDECSGGTSGVAVATEEAGWGIGSMSGISQCNE